MAAWLTALMVVGPLAANESPPRAKPPVWSQEVRDAFFEDARKELSGDRPDASQDSADEQSAASREESAETDGELRWSELISAEVVTSEIKRISTGLTIVLRRPANFKGGANLRCRRDFGLLAILFDVASKYDGEVRWKSSAELMRWKCVQAEIVCRTATNQSYAAAKMAHAEIADLIRGEVPRETLPATAAESLVDRTLLMQRMEVVLQEAISPAVADANVFRKSVREVSHQAQLLALLATVIAREGYDYVEDETYRDAAQDLRGAALEIVEACEEKNYEGARAAEGRAGQSCSRCHEDYRG